MQVLQFKVIMVWVTLIICSVSVSAGYELSNDQLVNVRVADLLSKMTLEEKLLLVHGDRATHLDIEPIERLGIPKFTMSDGPHGVRDGKVTSFPVGINMASSWNVELVEQVAVALGRESLAKGKDMQLGPCVNLHRVPHGGRNFESFSEDPFLAARIGVAYIKGMQSTGSVATVKHFACNNQEWNRKTINAVVSERALREIYLPPFKAAVQDAGVWTVMASYNRLNGAYACESKWLLRDILKDEWGFEGFVVSDWGSVHDTIRTANAGLDVEMPYGKFFGEPLLDEVFEANVTMDVLNDKVRRVLRVMILSGAMDETNKVDASVVNSEEHRQVALELSRESIVLLKNDAILPLDKSKVKKIAVIGPSADRAMIGGSGSSEVVPMHATSVLEGIEKLLGGDVQIEYAKGCLMESFGDIDPIDPNILFTSDGQPGLQGEYFDNPNLQGEPVHTRIDTKMDFWWGYNEPATGVPLRSFSVRWTGKIVPKKSGAYKLACISEPGSRLFFEGELLIDNWADHQVVTKTKDVQLEAGKEYPIRLEYYEKDYYAIVRLGCFYMETDMLAEAVQLAKESDVVIFAGGTDKPFEGEGHDRPDLQMPGGQNELLEEILKVNDKCIVVLQNGTPIVMDPWIEKVPAVVEAFFAGQDGGQAIAEVLFGEVNPSGKLPTTFPKRWEDSNAYTSFRRDPVTVVFDDDIYIGYRHFDKYGIEPLFAFGHGLSYTDFEYSGIEVSKVGDADVRVRMQLKNTGERAGAEVVQVYVRDMESSLDRPVQELKAFVKVRLQPNESRVVIFDLGKNALSFYDPAKKKWVMEPGVFEIRIGSSSRDIRLAEEVEL